MRFRNHNALAKLLAKLLAVGLSLLPLSLHAQISSYDGATGVLSLPSVSVGAATFTNVTLKNVGNFSFDLQGATAQVPPGPGVARFDLATNVVAIPAVKVGADTYLNVTLLHNGNYNFSLLGATPLAAGTLAEAAALFKSIDTLYATTMPASGAVRMQFADACFLHEGRSRAWFVNEVDSNVADYQARDRFAIGRITRNLQVLGERSSNNADGSTRHELDVQFDVFYADGSTDTGQQYTLISGSSSGTPRCSTAQTGSGWRLLGNQRLVQVSVRGRNLRDERYSISSGAPQSPALNYRRELRWFITDPEGRANYVIVSGPGPAASVNGSSIPFSLKLVSPRVMRAAPEFSGRNNNYLNWRDDDSFRYCATSGSGVPVASVADCAGLGAVADNWGITTATPNAAADANHQAQGFVAGGSYVFAVYADDGWKTVNGHVGRTPIATYTATLNKLSYSFVEMAGSGPSADKFPRLSFGGLSTLQVRNNLMSATPAPMNLSWTPLGGLLDNRAFRLYQAWEFFSGPQLGNLGGATFPAYRYIRFSYPGSTATSFNALPVSGRPAELNAKTYTEFNLQYLDRNDSEILSRLSFF